MKNKIVKRQKISALDAIRTFYVAEELLETIFKTSQKQNLKKIEGGLKRIIKQSQKISKKDLLTYHFGHFPPRYDNYLNSEWELKEIMIEECGVWPRMGGLPDKATSGSLVDTAQYVQELIKNKNKLTWETRDILYIEKMKKYAAIITKYIPIIVLEDGVIRHIKINNSAGYKRCKYDIDDGNHRAVALALLGKKKIKALVGKRICKSDLLY